MSSSICTLIELRVFNIVSILYNQIIMQLICVNIGYFACLQRKTLNQAICTDIMQHKLFSVVVVMYKDVKKSKCYTKNEVEINLIKFRHKNLHKQYATLKRLYSELYSFEVILPQNDCIGKR